MANSGVLLADCHTRSGLAVLRSLSRQGLEPVILSPTVSNVVSHSRHAKHFYLVPDPDENPGAFVDTVLMRAREHQVRVIMPISDGALMLLNAKRALLPEGTSLAAANEKAVNNVLNKEENLRLARRVGVPCVRQFPLLGPDGVTQCAKELGLPLVVKNPTPEVLVAEGGLPFRMKFPATLKELERIVRQCQRATVRPLFQEYVSGAAVNVAAFAEGGKVVAIHQYVSHRRSDHAGILREIVPLRADLEKYTCDMLAELRWDGLAQIGFIVDGERVWYMETNGRFWGSVQASVNGGWDMPHWQYRFFADRVTPSVQPIRIGSMTCHHGGDLKVLLQYLHGGRSPTFYTDPGRLWALKQYLASFRPSIHADVFNWRDPLPGLYEHGLVLKQYVRSTFHIGSQGAMP